MLGECLFPLYLGMLGKHPTDSSHLFAAARNNVEDAGREASQLREGSQGEGGEGRVLRRLEDTGAASRQRRCHLNIEKSRCVEAVHAGSSCSSS